MFQKIMGKVIIYVKMLYPIVKNVQISIYVWSAKIIIFFHDSSFCIEIVNYCKIKTKDIPKIFNFNLPLIEENINLFISEININNNKYIVLHLINNYYYYFVLILMILLRISRKY